MGDGCVLTVGDRMFNHGCPSNVPPGHNVNLDELIEHYRRKNREMAEKVEKKTDRQKLAAS